MATRLRSLLMLVPCACLMLFLVGCPDGGAENVGEEIDNAAENVQESAEEAAEEIEDAVDDVRN